MPEEEEEVEEEYRSGPFCQHFGALGECGSLCTCGHECRRHDDLDSECLEWECGCKKFVDSEPKLPGRWWP